MEGCVLKDEATSRYHIVRGANTVVNRNNALRFERMATTDKIEQRCFARTTRTGYGKNLSGPW